MNIKVFLFVALLFSSACSPTHRKLHLIFIGDSITYGATLEDPKSSAPPVRTVAYLKEKKGIENVDFDNLGFSGYTTVDFLPARGSTFSKVIHAGDQLEQNPGDLLLFSIMLGTNDSAVDGPNGAPVSPRSYKKNLQTIIDSLLTRYPKSKILINPPIWYSQTTHNRSIYLKEGLNRLQQYFPIIDQLVSSYQQHHPNAVFKGNDAAFDYFEKNHLDLYTIENGQDGVFYLHPNEQGADQLGQFWGEAIDHILEE